MGVRRRAIWIGTLLLLGTACEFREVKDSGDEPLTEFPGAPGYATVRARVFAPHCIRCHGDSGDVNLETWESARSAADLVRAEVLGGDMPPSGSLSANEIEWVRRWVDAGAPEHDR